MQCETYLMRGALPEAMGGGEWIEPEWLDVWDDEEEDDEEGEGIGRKRGRKGGFRSGGDDDDDWDGVCYISFRPSLPVFYSRGYPWTRWPFKGV